MKKLNPIILEELKQQVNELYNEGVSLQEITDLVVYRGKRFTKEEIKSLIN